MPRHTLAHNKRAIMILERLIDRGGRSVGIYVDLLAKTRVLDTFMRRRERAFI